MPEFSNWETYAWFQLSSTEDYNIPSWGTDRVAKLSIVVQEVPTSSEEYMAKWRLMPVSWRFSQTGYPCRSRPTIAFKNNVIMGFMSSIPLLTLLHVACSYITVEVEVYRGSRTCKYLVLTKDVVA